MKGSQWKKQEDPHTIIIAWKLVYIEVSYCVEDKLIYFRIIWIEPHKRHVVPTMGWYHIVSLMLVKSIQLLSSNIIDTCQGENNNAPSVLWPQCRPIITCCQEPFMLNTHTFNQVANNGSVHCGIALQITISLSHFPNVKARGLILSISSTHFSLAHPCFLALHVHLSPHDSCGVADRACSPTNEAYVSSSPSFIILSSTYIAVFSTLFWLLLKMIPKSIYEFISKWNSS